MLNKKLLVGVLASAASCAAYAEKSDLSYTYVNAAYVIGEVIDEDFTGLSVGGSAAINDSFFVLGQYGSLTSDDEYSIGFASDEIEFTQFNFGVGFHSPIERNVDFVASLSYVDVELEYLGVSEDGDGYLIDAGFRAKPTDVLEFGASVNYADIEGEGETGYSLLARFFAAPKFSIGVGYGSADDVDTISIDARFDI